MLDLTKKSLPNTIRIRGKDFSIYTDFRVWMKFMIEANKALLNGKGFDVAFLFKNDMPYRIDLKDLFEFANPKNPLPRNTRQTDDQVITLDYEIDSDLIYAAFLQQYSIDLIEVEDLHWWKFLALLKGLNGTKLDDVMKWRNYKKDTRKNVDVYEELRDAWEIQRELSEQEKQELEEFSKQFEIGGDENE